LSAWVYIDTPTCPTCDRGDEADGRNVTYNLQPMLVKAVGKRFLDLDGMPPMVCLSFIRAAIADMQWRPDVFRELEPDNRWGTSDTFLPWLREFAQALEQAPEGSVVRVSG
jgi:hypothetical protein